MLATLPQSTETDSSDEKEDKNYHACFSEKSPKRK